MIQPNHSSVASNQRSIHPRLRQTLQRHLNAPYQRPFPPFSSDVFEALEHILNNHSELLILDAGCGTGMSTVRLALHFPQATVIGIDKSAVKLSKNPWKRSGKLPRNCFLLRGTIEDVWRWLVQQKILIHYHLLWYPNPWPKSRHIKRRWYGHPAFPFLFQCSLCVELRTNWKIYAQEFALAATDITGSTPEITAFSPVTPLTPFEHKYARRGESLYKVRWYATDC